MTNYKRETRVLLLIRRRYRFAGKNGRFHGLQLKSDDASVEIKERTSATSSRLLTFPFPSRSSSATSN
jgi:hypothetical protein